MYNIAEVYLYVKRYSSIYMGKFRGMPLLWRASQNVEFLRFVALRGAPRLGRQGPQLVGGGGWGEAPIPGVMPINAEKNKKDAKRDLPLDNRAKPRYTVY